MKLKLIFGFIFFSAVAIAQVPGKAILSVTNLHKDLMNYYPFNGNANDESGHGKNGAVYGAVLDNGVNNAPQSAYRFDGAQYISFPMDSTVNWNGYTIMGWNKISNGKETRLLTGTFSPSEICREP